MFEIKGTTLHCSFPDVHKDAKLLINFQRTLRIPDDGKTYPLPPGLGNFPLKHLDDYPENVPHDWLKRGGIMLPMYQSEALWMRFNSSSASGLPYPFAVKVGAGKICAVTGKNLSNDLESRKQNYLSIPTQPWLDGFCVKKGSIRQFVAMPLGSGYTAEEQITGEAEFGGLQIIVYPMKAQCYERRLQEYLKKTEMRRSRVRSRRIATQSMAKRGTAMGLAPGGKMKQTIHKDPNNFDEWDTTVRSRCFVHLCNSLTWREITGNNPPTTPITSKEYNKHGLPWYDLYEDPNHAVKGSKILGSLKSIATLGSTKNDTPLPENQSIKPKKIRKIIRDGEF